MPRIVSVWLSDWPITRFRLAQKRHGRAGDAPQPDRPFVLTTETSGGPHVAAADSRAVAVGIAPGDSLADARAKAAGPLAVRPADPASDLRALRRLALWATRYTPAVTPWSGVSGSDGLFLDVSGAAHLVGGEPRLVVDLENRLAGFGLQARAVLAETAGAGWALVRHGREARRVLPAGEEARALAPLPIQALRLDPGNAAALSRLGFKRIGDLLDQPRAPFAARFGRPLLAALDQALGRAPEPLVPLAPPPAYEAVRALLEPLQAQEAIVTVAHDLMAEIAGALERDGAGARRLRLSLYRVDGRMIAIPIGLAEPRRDAGHLARLVALRLERMGETLDAGFGFEAVRLAVTEAGPVARHQGRLDPSRAGSDRSAAIMDILRQRLGARSLTRLEPRESHLPERAVSRAPFDGTSAGYGLHMVRGAQRPLHRPAGGPPPPQAGEDGRVSSPAQRGRGTMRSMVEGAAHAHYALPRYAPPRPPLLLKRAEPAEVLAEVPEGPPRRFRWRGLVHDVVHAQGPERIAAEWWRQPTPQPTRDYYRVEDAAGRRFWLYREGLYGRETETARWFMHGLFP